MKAADLDQHALRRPQKNISAADRFLVAEKRNSAVLHFADFISKIRDFPSKNRLQTEMTRCNQFHFSHFFFHFYRCTGSITPAFIPRQLCLDIYAQASLPRHLFFDFSLFLLYGHFLWAVKENAPKFLPTQKAVSYTHLAASIGIVPLPQNGSTKIRSAFQGVSIIKAAARFSAIGAFAVSLR